MRRQDQSKLICRDGPVVVAVFLMGPPLAASAFEARAPPNLTDVAMGDHPPARAPHHFLNQSKNAIIILRKSNHGVGDRLLLLETDRWYF
jgi:hypothetical protein